MTSLSGGAAMAAVPDIPDGDLLQVLDDLLLEVRLCHRHRALGEGRTQRAALATACCIAGCAFTGEKVFRCVEWVSCDSRLHLERICFVDLIRYQGGSYARTPTRTFPMAMEDSLFLYRQAVMRLSAFCNHCRSRSAADPRKHVPALL